MGGAIGFTLREENGKEHRMCRWTNITPWAVDNMGIVLKDPVHVQTVLAGWYKLAEDYESGQNKSPMASCYVPYAGLNPVEYGLVVVDMQKNVILDMNDYHRMCSMSAVCLSNELYDITRSAHGKKKLKQRKLGDDDNDVVRFMDFVVAGRVREVQYYDKDTDSVLTKPVQMTTLDEAVAYVENKKHSYENIMLDMSPFEVRVFDRNKKGCGELYAAVKELGFLLSEKEEEAWKEYMRRWDDD